MLIKEIPFWKSNLVKLKKKCRSW